MSLLTKKQREYFKNQNIVTLENYVDEIEKYFINGYRVTEYQFFQYYDFCEKYFMFNGYTRNGVRTYLKKRRK